MCVVCGNNAYLRVCGLWQQRTSTTHLNNAPLRYGADERAQKLKYHIQTSGRSLHAQEVQFNDIRTTLQALLAIQDQCNSLHTVRDAMTPAPLARSLAARD